MVIGIVGSRRRNETIDYVLVEHEMRKVYQAGDTLVSGGCPVGADHFAEVLSGLHGIPIRIYRADWTKYGRGAGFVRNGLIAADADVLIACVAEDRTGGTEDTIKKYLKLGKDKLILC